jgi:large subunit ribosomal protein L23
MSIFSKFKKDKEEKKDIPKKREVGADLPLEKNKAFKKDIKRNIGGGYGVIVRPIVAEKASYLGARGQYVFEALKGANKIQIGKAIEKMYGVKPVKVNIIKIKGKAVRYGKTMGKTKSWKKAIVTLPKETKIEIYEGV